MSQDASAQLGGLIDKAKQKAQQIEKTKIGLGASTASSGYEFFYFPATSGGKSIEFYTPIFAAPKQENVITTWGSFRQFVLEKYGAQAIPGRNRSYYAQASETLSLDAQKRQRISEARAGGNGFAPAEIVETGWTPEAGASSETTAGTGGGSSPMPSASGRGSSTAQPSSGESSRSALAVSSSEGAYRQDHHYGGASADPLPFNTEREGSLLATTYRYNLLLMRYHPELIDEFAAKMTGRVLNAEIRARQDMNNRPGKAPYFLRSYGFEWPQLRATNSKFADGPLLDVLLRPDADWSFLKDQPGWDDSKRAWVGVFLFPAAVDAPDKNFDFAVHDGTPYMKQLLSAAAKRESNELFYVLPVASSYDIDKQTLGFGAKDIADVLPMNSKSFLANRALYGAVQARGGEVQRNPGYFRGSFVELDAWRDMSDFKAYPDGLALDRELRLPDIPVDRSRAEAFHLGSNVGLIARVFVTVDRADPFPEHGDHYALGARVKKIELLTTTGEGGTISTITPAMLPPPGSHSITPKADTMPKGPSHPAAFPGADHHPSEAAKP